FLLLAQFLEKPLVLGLLVLVIVHHTDHAQPAVLRKELVEWRCPFAAVLFTGSSKAVDAVFVVAAQPLHLRPHLTQFLAQPLNFCYGTLVVLRPPAPAVLAVRALVVSHCCSPPPARPRCACRRCRNNWVRARCR